jgi:hypothetical protein
MGSDPLILLLSLIHFASSKSIEYDSISRRLFLATALAFAERSYLRVIGPMRLFVE